MVIVKFIQKLDGRELDYAQAHCVDMEDAKKAIEYARKNGLLEVCDPVIVKDATDEDTAGMKKVIDSYVDGQKQAMLDAKLDEIIASYRNQEISGATARAQITALYGNDEDAIEQALIQMYRPEYDADDDDDYDDGYDGCDYDDDDRDYYNRHDDREPRKLRPDLWHKLLDALEDIRSDCDDDALREALEKYNRDYLY